ncbi:hypothetical protein HY085_00910 [Candidatus Gottesmanbacteria bacterium]|nr:hypothetical protein [Candidatus Gottesmanbacteria bacterium]
MTELEQLAKILLEEQEKAGLSWRGEKLRRILLLLAGGIALSVVLTMPGTALLFKDFVKDDSAWKEWKKFNLGYLRKTLKKLEKQKLVEVEEKDGRAIIKLTAAGQKKVLEANLDRLKIEKPARWDGKWRLIFYDILDGKRETRDKFRQILKSLEFYPLQESVYLHAFPCEKEVEFLRHYLGITGEVRLITAEKIENDQLFRDYFDI